MPNINLRRNDDGKSFEVHIGDSISIRLKENATTGFRWTIDKNNDKIMATKSSEFLIEKDSEFGSGGIRLFTYIAKSAGISHIKLKHWREWEGESSIIDSFRVTVVVKS